MSQLTEAQLVERLQALRQPPPDDGFAQRLSERLAREAESLVDPVPLRRSRSRRGRVIALAAVAVPLAAMAAAAASGWWVSDPGEPPTRVLPKPARVESRAKPEPVRRRAPARPVRSVEMDPPEAPAVERVAPKAPPVRSVAPPKREPTSVDRPGNTPEPEGASSRSTESREGPPPEHPVEAPLPRVSIGHRSSPQPSPTAEPEASRELRSRTLRREDSTRERARGDRTEREPWQQHRDDANKRERREQRRHQPGPRGR